ncbi:Major facilitator superfamily transporter [Pyrenophora tritici-repentis]|nr:Major facilitator superfamily transporter [Pyrenophora tritici-repentis]
MKEIGASGAETKPGSNDDTANHTDDSENQRTASSSTFSIEQKHQIPSRLPLRRMWTRNFVLLLITSSIHDAHLAAYTSLWVNFLSDPVVKWASGDLLPFRFSGGVGMAPSDIGWTLSVIGVLGLPLQFLVFPMSPRNWEFYVHGNCLCEDSQSPIALRHTWLSLLGSHPPCLKASTALQFGRWQYLCSQP